MKASEVVAKLLELAEAHGDPHVYAYAHESTCVLAVEPEAIAVVHPGGIEPMLLIVGQPWAESKDVKAFLAKAE